MFVARALRPAARAAHLARAVRASSSVALNPADLSPRAAAPGQAPNRAKPWSEDQQPKADAYDNPRFEQVNLPLQPDGLSAMALVNEQPIVKLEARRAVCDGGGGPLGHPKIYINLDKPGAHACGYCGARFEQEHHH
ncbi:hypothetical protein CC85DRAFT_283558 [Cutaneotrichosporon oleaginosum]|uniref:Zinc finger CHCC-type domain-containing protein n=1 Tax=Cutaneotrichosporon oleaginosum TaxID=879819 RepID=A0A0J0XTB5_9TREE|nr:uncharacterized protein CC85DRAFT_283558 [Cutaneotrichosporon oleaginosum]KLT44315.1 hypothetical protein CC85DRAFT_283558 [Cutaneotrichosporon oleaginosum]TXT07957.1 hypothetical protein COLE_04881 [Cutaneotrichosporon oleaginosum]